tara:strand:+ start:1391 stop:2221 length:831 start_codon:yes stop_codon:yes gene_type:complete
MQTTNTIDYLQINKLSRLHNGHDIFFCKTDYILQDFAAISKLDRDVVLITGNSDYAIPDEAVNQCPDNVKVWYAQNCLSNNEKMKPLPIGIENKEVALREGHGIGYLDRVTKKENIFNNLKSLSPYSKITADKFMYSNFVVRNNPTHRSLAKEISIKQPYIDWEEPNLSLERLFLNFLEYKMILCPIGNGIDTHRLWETLYCGRIPVTIKVGDFKLYSLYEQLPIVILDGYSELMQQESIQEKYNNVISKKYNIDMLSTQYWIESVISDAKNLNHR